MCSPWLLANARRLHDAELLSVRRVRAALSTAQPVQLVGVDQRDSSGQHSSPEPHPAGLAASSTEAPEKSAHTDRQTTHCCCCCCCCLPHSGTHRLAARPAHTYTNATACCCPLLLLLHASGLYRRHRVTKQTDRAPPQGTMVVYVYIRFNDCIAVGRSPLLATV